jgi:hypothetical protein
VHRLRTPEHLPGVRPHHQAQDRGERPAAQPRDLPHPGEGQLGRLAFAAQLAGGEGGQRGPQVGVEPAVPVGEVGRGVGDQVRHGGEITGLPCGEVSRPGLRGTVLRGRCDRSRCGRGRIGQGQFRIGPRLLGGRGPRRRRGHHGPRCRHHPVHAEGDDRDRRGGQHEEPSIPHNRLLPWVSTVAHQRKDRKGDDQWRTRLFSTSVPERGWRRPRIFAGSATVSPARPTAGDRGSLDRVNVSGRRANGDRRRDRPHGRRRPGRG